MSKKKGAPVITQVEIISLALSCLEGRVAEWRRKLEGKADAEELLEACCRNDLNKIEALKVLYYMETGTDY